MAKTDFRRVDDYIATFPAEVQATLQAVRQAIRKAVPKAEESISYQMPAFKLGGRPVLYLAAYKRHWSLFGAAPSVRTAFRERLAPYEQAKGTLRFPLDEPVPLKLVRDLAKAQAKEVLERDA